MIYEIKLSFSTKMLGDIALLWYVQLAFMRHWFQTPAPPKKQKQNQNPETGGQKKCKFLKVTLAKRDQ